jgi:hypothetical protein
MKYLCFRSPRVCCFLLPLFASPDRNTLASLRDEPSTVELVAPAIQTSAPGSLRMCLHGVRPLFSPAAWLKLLPYRSSTASVSLILLSDVPQGVVAACLNPDESIFRFISHFRAVTAGSAQTALVTLSTQRTALKWDKHVPW